MIGISWEERTALFGAFLVNTGIQSSTLKSYISVIKHIIRIDNYEWDDSKVFLNILIRGCKYQNNVIKTRMPIGKNLLEAILFELERIYPDQPYLEILYKAIFILAYYGLFRIGKLVSVNSDHAIKACNVHIGRDKDKILVVLFSSKTHGKASRLQQVKISAISNRSSCTSNTKFKFFCPFQVARTYLKLHGSFLSDDDPFFLFKDGSHITAHAVRKVLKSCLNRLNMDSSLFNTQSFCIGCVTQLFKSGYTVDQIKQARCWESNAIYKYLRN